MDIQSEQVTNLCPFTSYFYKKNSQHVTLIGHYSYKAIIDVLYILLLLGVMELLAYVFSHIIPLYMIL